MPLFPPNRGVMGFQKQIERLAKTGSATIEAVVQTFRELEADEVSMAGYCINGYALMYETGQVIESIDYPFSTIFAAQFATGSLCQLYSEALANARSAPRGELEEIIYRFSDTYVIITPLAIEGLCLVMLVTK